MKHIVTYWAPNHDPHNSETEPFKLPMVLRAYWVQGDNAAYVGGPVEAGGYLYLGVSTVESPWDVMGARLIRYANEIPDLRSLGSQWAVILADEDKVAMCS